MKTLITVALTCLIVSNNTVAKLIQDLQLEASVPARVAALKSLAAAGPAAAKAVPAIIDTLNENRAGAATGIGIGKPISPAITDAALIALAKIGHAAHDAAPYLTPLLKDKNELLRRPAVLDTLNAIGPSSESGAILMQMVGEEGKLTRTRAVAIEVLGKVDPPVVEACDMLREISDDRTDLQCKDAATKALQSIVSRAQAAARASSSPEDKTLAVLRSQLDEKYPNESRVQTLEQIAELGPKAGPIVPTLMTLVNDRDDAVRHADLSALASVGTPALVAIPSLITKFLGEANENERGYFCRAISKIDPSGRRTVPLLQEALDDPFRARLAIQLLNELGTDDTTSLAQKARQRWRIKD
jgi:HEAT repeat protein